MHTTGMPLSMQVTVVPSMTSVTFPVGQQRAARGAGDVGELDGDGCVGAGHAVDARGPVVADAATRRLDQSRREGLGVAHPDRGPASRGRRAGTSPWSIANGPTAASMLPQF